MRYILDAKKFKQSILGKGFRNVAHFAKKSGIHRNTLRNLLLGKNVFANAFREVAEKLGVDPLDLIVPRTKFKVRIPHIEELATIVAKLVKEDKEMAVVLLGSRANKKAKEYSDWDLGLIKHEIPISGRQYLRLKGMVEEMSENLVRTIDLINLNQAPSWFFENLREGMIFLGGHEPAFIYLKGVLDGIRKEEAA